MLNRLSEELGPPIVVHTLLGKTIGNADVNSGRREYTIDLRKHLVGIGARAITADNEVECALFDQGIKSAIIILQASHVHLL